MLERQQSVKRSGWKAAERRMARDVGTERIPVTGERAGADFENGMFCFQLKVRSMLPGWMFEWLYGICANAQPKGKIGVLILKAPGMRDSEALVCVKWGDWVALHGSPRAE